jgi:hypothetical protein
LIESRSFTVKYKALSAVIAITENDPEIVDMQFLEMLSDIMDDATLKPIVWALVGLLVRAVDEMTLDAMREMLGGMEESGILARLDELEKEELVSPECALWMSKLAGLMSMAQ